MTLPEEIREKYDLFVSDHKRFPEYFYGKVIFKGPGEDIIEVVIKLSLDIDITEDDEIFYYCKDIGELLSLVESGREDFLIIECKTFF